MNVYVSLSELTSITHTENWDFRERILLFIYSGNRNSCTLIKFFMFVLDCIFCFYSHPDWEGSDLDLKISQYCIR